MEQKYGIMLPATEQKVEVVMTLHLEDTNMVDKTVKLGCQLLCLLNLDGEANIQYAIFGDKVIFSRVVTRTDFNFQNFALN